MPEFKIHELTGLDPVIALDSGDHRVKPGGDGSISLFDRMIHAI